MKKWHLQKRLLAQLKDHPKNPRYLSKENGKHLMQSMAKFGLIDKPIITCDGMIIGGHQRVRVLKDLGHEEIECWVCDEELSDEEIDELCIRLNRNMGEFDWDCLANEWEPMDLIKWGFTEQELGIVSEKKKGKTKVVLEFEDPAHLENCIHDLDERAGVWGVKVTVKLPKVA